MKRKRIIYQLTPNQLQATADNTFIICMDFSAQNKKFFTIMLTNNNGQLQIA